MEQDLQVILGGDSELTGGTRFQTLNFMHNHSAHHSRFSPLQNVARNMQIIWRLKGLTKFLLD